jgi:hypothetical protein
MELMYERMDLQKLHKSLLYLISNYTHKNAVNLYYKVQEWPDDTIITLRYKVLEVIEKILRLDKFMTLKLSDEHAELKKSVLKNIIFPEKEKITHTLTFSESDFQSKSSLPFKWYETNWRLELRRNFERLGVFLCNTEIEESKSLTEARTFTTTISINKRIKVAFLKTWKDVKSYGVHNICENDQELADLEFNKLFSPGYELTDNDRRISVTLTLSCESVKLEKLDPQSDIVNQICSICEEILQCRLDKQHNEYQQTYFIQQQNHDQKLIHYESLANKAVEERKILEKENINLHSQLEEAENRANKAQEENEVLKNENANLNMKLKQIQQNLKKKRKYNTYCNYTRTCLQETTS